MRTTAAFKLVCALVHSFYELMWIEKGKPQWEPVYSCFYTQLMLNKLHNFTFQSASFCKF